MKTLQKLGYNTHLFQKASKVTDKVQLLDAGTAQQLLSITTKTLRRLQKQDRFCEKKVHKIKTGTHNEFYLNSKNILKRKIIVNNMEVNSPVIQTPFTYTLLHEFHNCKGHQGSARTFNMLQCQFWCKVMRLDVKNHINNCITCRCRFLILFGITYIVEPSSSSLKQNKISLFSQAFTS